MSVVRRAELAALLAVLLAACASPVPTWVERPPVPCALGHSGATLHPGDALRRARHRALQELVRRDAGTKVERESVDVGGEVHTWTRQETRGRLRRARVVALWTETREKRSRLTRRGDVYALACAAEHAGAVPEPPYPDWILDPPERSARLCAPAVAGPTLEPADQEPAALRDGRRALAESLESRVHQVLVDTERGAPRVAGEVEATPRARSLSETAVLERTWLDRRGEGPMGFRGTLYGLVCTGPS